MRKLVEFLFEPLCFVGLDFEVQIFIEKNVEFDYFDL